MGFHIHTAGAAVRGLSHSPLGAAQVSMWLVLVYNHVNRVQSREHRLSWYYEYSMQPATGEGGNSDCRLTNAFTFCVEAF